MSFASKSGLVMTAQSTSMQPSILDALLSIWSLQSLLIVQSILCSCKSPDHACHSSCCPNASTIGTAALYSIAQNRL